MTYFGVAIGGFIGAILRYIVSLEVMHHSTFPAATLITNILGSFVLAAFYTATSGYIRISPVLRASIGTGLIGAFTTFSTFSVETWRMVLDGHLIESAVYVVASALLCLFVTYLGYLLGAAISQRGLNQGSGGTNP